MGFFKKKEYDKLQGTSIEAAREKAREEAQWRAELDKALGEEIYMLVKKDENNVHLAPTLDAKGWMQAGDIPKGMAIIRLRKGMLLSHDYYHCPNCELYFDLNVHLKNCLCGKSLPKIIRVK